MTLAFAARYLGKKCYILLFLEEGLDGEALYGETSITPPSGGILRSLVLGTVNLGLLHCLKRPFLAPGEDLDLIFLPVGISGLRPLAHC